LDSNVVSVEGGPLVVTVTWQRGVLGVGDDKEEDDFARKVSGELKALLGKIAANDL
jgi:hypothetical protein